MIATDDADVYGQLLDADGTQSGPDDFLIGESLGPYKIIEQLGAGGMGEVYLGEDTRLGRKVAIKVLNPLLSLRPDVKDRFMREARSAGKLLHPGIVTVFDAGESEGSLYLAMEYVEGRTLKQILDAAGDRFQMHEPKTWPEQAKLAADGRWEELDKLQDLLRGGRED